jgi:transposase-like protein
MCGKGTRKQCVLVAVERKGLVHAVPVSSDKTSELFPWINQWVQKDAHLMSDENHVYRKIGQQYASHSCVKHSMEELVRGDVHNNTAE